MQSCAFIFADQHGVGADHQIRACGVSLRQQKSLIAAGTWTRHCAGVVGASGAPATWKQRVMVAVLAVRGAAACGRSAARLHGFDGFGSFDGVKIAIPRPARGAAVPGVRYTSMSRLSDGQIEIIDGIPVMGVPLTLIHLAAGGHSAAKALDGVLRGGFDPTLLREFFEGWRNRGVSGPSEMLDLLADRIDRRLPRSWFQRVAKDVFARHGIRLVDEWPVHDAQGRPLAELDLACVELMVGVECQSWEWHGSPAAQLRDLRRKRALRALGWDIVDVWWADLHRPAEVLADLALALTNARARILARERTESV